MASAVTIVRGTNDKPVSSEELVRFFANGVDVGEASLFVGFPIIGTAEGRHRIDALLISPKHGIVVFDLIEGPNPGDFESRQDDSANKLEARLRTHRELLDRRKLLIPISSISFAPGIAEPAQFVEPDGTPLANVDSLREQLGQLGWTEQRDDIFRAALSAIQNISAIRKSRTRRVVSKENSRGAKLKRLEDSIATLDNLQSKAVVETVDDVQRIRGLAGSGKTIVLALKAAYLHAQHPEWRIAVTFNTRSLKGQFRRLINNFSLEQTGEEPDWEKLRILNAWGAPGGIERDGLYHAFCRAHEIDYLDFGSARDKFGERAFAGACEAALGQARNIKPLYDAILVDEAQDFPPSFLRLCYESTQEPKRLVYAYDELQDLTGASLPPREEIFGKHADGTPRVTAHTDEAEEARYDIILEKCYRNSRPVLVSAHSLGFGIYRTPTALGELGIVQMFDDSQLWYEIGYRRKSGELRDGAPVVLNRTEETSPKFLEEHSQVDDLLQFIVFKDADEQADWLAEEISKNLQHDELRHDDIIVINPDPRTTRAKVGPIRRRLLDLGINSHLAGVDTNPDVFFQPEVQSITFTGIYRAKGNEAGMVYIVNAQDCEAAWNLATVRNQLFTAITRSKAWVRVLGIGDRMKNLVREYRELEKRDFELHFTYPTEEQRKKLKIVHRDMSPEQRKRVRDRQQSLADLLSDLESGALLVEDLDDKLRAKLQAVLRKSS